MGRQINPEGTTRELLHEFARERLEKGQVFNRRAAVAWFKRRYPKTKPNTVAMHVRGMAVNDPDWRRFHPSIKPGSGHDLFYKIAPDDNFHFRLWDKKKDPAPLYGYDASGASSRGRRPPRPRRAAGSRGRPGGWVNPEGSTKDLLREFARGLGPRDVFTQQDAVDWFGKRYPKTSPRTVALHVRSMTTNDRAWRRARRRVQPGKGFDLFFRVDEGEGVKLFRRWNPRRDPKPVYGPPRRSAARARAGEATEEEGDADEDDASEETPETFRLERELRDRLAKDLGKLERGLRLHPGGVEFPVPGGYIDILALDRRGDLVVIELKRRKCHKKTVGQIAYYLACLTRDPPGGRRGARRQVRGALVGSKIPPKTRVAASMLPSVRLYEYTARPLRFRRVRG